MEESVPSEAPVGNKVSLGDIATRETKVSLVKSILLNTNANTNNKNIKSKEKVVRKEATQWTLPSEYLEATNQPLILDCSASVYSLAKKQIMHKIYGYKSQDIEKNKYDSTRFVDYDFVCALLKEKDFKCYYCSKPVYIFYNYVRENSQWTLERIDNSMGHNKDNVQIACLLCNLRRRTMHHERYLKTKQMLVVKKLDS
jgi:hypothetical protein